MRISASWLLRTLAAVTLLVGASALADHHASWGPELGTGLSNTLTVTAQDGATLSVSELAIDKGLAIAFVRSADWCPFCKRQIIELNKNRDEFRKRGVNLVALSYDSVAILKEFSNEQDIGITLLSDPNSKVIDAFGIRNEDHEKGSTGYGIPHPGIMVFDTHGKLVAKFAEKGYRKRPPVESVLEAIDTHL